MKETRTIIGLNPSNGGLQFNVYDTYESVVLTIENAQLSKVGASFLGVDGLLYLSSEAISNVLYILVTEVKVDNPRIVTPR